MFPFENKDKLYIANVKIFVINSSISYQDTGGWWCMIKKFRLLLSMIELDPVPADP